VAIFGNLFGQIFGDSAAELEAQGDHYAGVNNWRRAADEYRRALAKTSKSAIGYRRLAAKYDESRIKSFESMVEEIHSYIDVREFTYATDQLALARSLAENDAQLEQVEECERRLRSAGRQPRGVAAKLEEGARTAAANGDGAAARVERAPASAPAPEARVAPAPAAVPAASLATESTDLQLQRLLAGMTPAEVAARSRLGGHYRDGALAYAKGDAQRAVVEFTKSLAEHPQNLIVHYDLAAALAAAGRTREAQSVYLKITKLAPADWQPYYEVAQILWLDGLPDRAVATIDEGLERFPRSGYLMAQAGVFLYKLGDPRAALDKFYQALQLDAFDDAGLYHVIANLHRELDEPEKARRAYGKALELAPGSVGSMLDYAEFLLQKKQDAAAATTMLEQAANELQGNHKPGVKLFQVYRSYLASRAHLQAGEREMALLAITRALEDNDQSWLEEPLEQQRQAVLAV
jgi:tetratricopeptide (TPR) repeat protein